MNVEPQLEFDESPQAKKNSTYKKYDKTQKKACKMLRNLKGSILAPCESVKNLNSFHDFESK